MSSKIITRLYTIEAGKEKALPWIMTDTKTYAKLVEAVKEETGAVLFDGAHGDGSLNSIFSIKDEKLVYVDQDGEVKEVPFTRGYLSAFDEAKTYKDEDIVAHANSVHIRNAPGAGAFDTSVWLEADSGHLLTGLSLYDTKTTSFESIAEAVIIKADDTTFYDVPAVPIILGPVMVAEELAALRIKYVGTEIVVDSGSEVIEFEVTEDGDLVLLLSRPLPEGEEIILDGQNLVHVKPS